MIWRRDVHGCYEDRVIQVEHDGCFTPLVFSTSGGMGPSSSIIFKRFAPRLATIAPYSSVLSWTCCKSSISLIHSATLDLQGTDSHSSYSSFFGL